MDISLILAIYGAILSTILAIREISLLVTEFIKNKRRLKVNLYLGTQMKTKGKYYDYIAIVATNIGYRPVTITDVGFSYNLKRPLIGRASGYGRTHDFFDNKIKLPVKLEDGDSLTFHFEEKAVLELTNNVARITAIIKDTEGKSYIARFNKSDMEFLISRHNKLFS